MSNTLSIKEWCSVIKEEYLEGFVREGGSSIKFAVPSGDHLSVLLKDAIRSISSSLGYMVVEVDSGETRVHMPQEIFFQIAQQIDWLLLARRVLLRLCQDAGYVTDAIDPEHEHSIIQAVSAANSVEEGMIALDLPSPLFRAVAQNANMSVDFRVAMTQLCRMEMRPAELGQEANPLIEWLTGRNRRVSHVRDFSIRNAIVRTNARHFLQSLLYWVRFVGYSGMVVLLDNSRVTLRRNPRDGLLFYSRTATLDHYELLRELIDGTDRLEGLFMAVLADQGFLDPDNQQRGYGIYQALRWRIGDEVRDRNQGNPMATLVRLADSTF